MTGTGAGDLRERVIFAARGSANPDAPNDYGNTVAGWVDQFEVWGGYRHLRGGEAVMAARLQGRHMQVITVRASTQSRQVTTDWRARDRFSGQVFEIRDVTLLPGGAWIDFLCETGAG